VCAIRLVKWVYSEYMNYFARYKAYLRNNPHHYWFKRKIYGWGWTPATGEGWLTLAVFVGLLVLNAWRIDSLSHSASDMLVNFLPQTVLLVLILIAICYKTGEPPRWQWGLPDNDPIR
jgi:hypothetical protein